jgi:hypothetical protein
VLSFLDRKGAPRVLNYSLQHLMNHKGHEGHKDQAKTEWPLSRFVTFVSFVVQRIEQEETE